MEGSKQTKSSIMIVADEAVQGQRLDVFLAGCAQLSLSRNSAVLLIQNGHVTVNGKPTVKKYLIKAKDLISVTLPSPEKTDIQPEPIPLQILYQDDDLAVVNKPQGLVVHPANGHLSGTLVHALLYHLDHLSGINGELRPGIVHRLDKNTSGLLVVAKNDQAHRALSKQFKERSCKKLYLAVVEGVVKEDNGRVNQPIARALKDRKKMAVSQNGRDAVTEYQVLKRYKDATLLSCNLLTGRTHQIRVHMAFIGHPCLGDPLYGFAKQRLRLKGQALHSYQLTFCHPRTGQEMSFQAPIPESMQNLLQKLQKQIDSTKTI